MPTITSEHVDSTARLIVGRVQLASAALYVQHRDISVVLDMSMYPPRAFEVTGIAIHTDDEGFDAVTALSGYWLADSSSYQPGQRMSYVDNQPIAEFSNHGQRFWAAVDPYQPERVSCDSCGDRFYENDGYWCDDCSAYRCESCGPCFEDTTPDDDYSSTGSYVRSWDYRPNNWRPKGEWPGHALMGLELEVSGYARTISQVVRQFDDCEDHLYMKDDGSISGVEIVTHPATLAWSREYPFADMLANLRNAGCSIGEGYGLHIHVSRNAFRRAGKRSTPHQLAWLMFMYRNARELQLLARRQSSRWAEFSTPAPGELKRKANNAPSNDNRYVAVNCNNERTYELRFFKATLDETEFFAALEFADASVEYTREIKTPDILRGQALTWAHFRTWVDGHNYPNLSAEIAARVPASPARRRTVRTDGRPVTVNGSPTRVVTLQTAMRRVGHGGIVQFVGSIGRRPLAPTLYEVRHDYEGAPWFLRGHQSHVDGYDTPLWLDSWERCTTFRNDGWAIYSSALANV